MKQDRHPPTSWPRDSPNSRLRPPVRRRSFAGALVSAQSREVGITPEMPVVESERGSRDRFGGRVNIDADLREESFGRPANGVQSAGPGRHGGQHRPPELGPAVTTPSKVADQHEGKGAAAIMRCFWCRSACDGDWQGLVVFRVWGHVDDSYVGRS